MDATDFISAVPRDPRNPAPRDGIVVIATSDIERTKIYDLQVDMIAEACPILAESFEKCRSGRIANFEGYSTEAVISFLRWTYTLELLPPGLPLEQVSAKTLLEVYSLAFNFGSTLLAECAAGLFTTAIEESRRPGHRRLDIAPALAFLHDRLDCVQPHYDLAVEYCAGTITENLISNRSFLRLIQSRPKLHRDIFEACAARDDYDVAHVLVKLTFNSYNIEENFGSRSAARSLRRRPLPIILKEQHGLRRRHEDTVDDTAPSSHKRSRSSEEQSTDAWLLGLEEAMLELQGEDARPGDDDDVASAGSGSASGPADDAAEQHQGRTEDEPLPEDQCGSAIDQSHDLIPPWQAVLPNRAHRRLYEVLGGSSDDNIDHDDYDVVDIPLPPAIAAATPEKSVGKQSMEGDVLFAVVEPVLVDKGKRPATAIADSPPRSLASSPRHGWEWVAPAGSVEPTDADPVKSREDQDAGADDSLSDDDFVLVDGEAVCL